METCAPATSWHHQHRPLPKTSEASPISAETIRQRDDAYYDQGRRAVERAVHDLCSGASVTLTGSIVHGLHLPAPASDMDLLNTGRSRVHVGDVHPDGVGLAVANSSVTIDITWNVANVDESRRLVGAAMRHTLFKRITMYMKHYLFMHGLGVPYHGGLGSFPLYLPVIFHLQVNCVSNTMRAGACLRAFFAFYGRTFHVEQHCVSLRTNGRPLPKAERAQRGPQDDTRLCIEIPFDSSVDVGRSAFNFGAIRQQLYKTIKAAIDILTWAKERTAKVAGPEPPQAGLWHSTSAMLLVVFVIACTGVHAAGNRRSVKRASPRADASLPASPSPEIRDAIVLLEQARVMLCEAESPTGITAPSASGKPSRSASSLKADAHLHKRLKQLGPANRISRIKTADFVSAFCEQTSFPVAIIVAQHARDIPEAARVYQCKTLALAASENLCDYMDANVSAATRARDTKFQDLPALWFWGSTKVTPEEVVSAARETRKQIVLAREALKTARERNLHMQQVIKTYIMFCDTVAVVLCRPILAAAAHSRLEQKADLRYALGLANDMKKGLVQFTKDLRAPMDHLEQHLGQLKHAGNIADQVINTMHGLITAPVTPAEQTVTPTTRKAKSRKKKKAASSPNLTIDVTNAPDQYCDIGATNEFGGEDAADHFPELVVYVDDDGAPSDVSLTLSLTTVVENETAVWELPSLQDKSGPQACNNSTGATPASVPHDDAKVMADSPGPTFAEQAGDRIVAANDSLVKACDSPATNASGETTTTDEDVTSSARPILPGTYDDGFPALSSVSSMTGSRSGSNDVCSSEVSPTPVATSGSNGSSRTVSGMGSMLSASASPFCPARVRHLDWSPQQRRLLLHTPTSPNPPMHMVPPMAAEQDSQLTVDLHEFVAKAERGRRRDDVHYGRAYDAVDRAVCHLFLNATVNVAGSVAYGLHLRAPTSDLDLVIQHPTETWSNGLPALYRYMLADDTFSSVFYIPTARTPIIKATVAKSLVNVDITWRVANVDEFRHLIADTMTLFPLVFKTITLYMKHYLYMYGLGTPYFGGLGSFPLYLLVIFHLQVNAVACAVSAGTCLRTFFGFYGFVFPVDDHCVSVNTGGRPIPKPDLVGVHGQPDAERLCIVSPFDATDADVGRSAFNFAAIRQRFSSTYAALTTSGSGQVILRLSDKAPTGTCLDKRT
ncbi:unnamed protein product (mitochondrion) [Plasmodiophora brassicae]|uniref:PAP-associated domain-containing protein n=1 Tax=Plasmodiophora brassicae TaxID=37360 RepID=A0A3P3Y4W1_PLABS|nr:unnamed protein product [Plasmodiophora brassicae]